MIQDEDDESIFALLYSVRLEPKQIRHWGFMGLGSYGNDHFNDKVVSEVVFFGDVEILEYAPMTNSSKDIVGVKLGLKGISINELLRLSDKNIIDEISVVDNEYKSTINYNSLHKESSDILRRPDTIRGFVHFRKNGDSNISYNVRHNVKYSQQSNIRNGSGDVYFSHSVEL